ncbi:deoxyribonuclease HsdR [Pasteurellaceae bacterium RH1A]|nr:deoxyribonuclease HsdR [Pasteurellaceae bacterium RH1A]
MKKLFVTALAALGLVGCATTEQVNNQAAQNYLSVKQEMYAKSAVDTSSTTSKRIQAVFNKMKPYAERANQTGVPFDWEILVLKSEQLNAWAMAGGKMAFYTGLVDKLKLTNDEIAVVMGHEMAHALKEHSKSDQTVGTITGVIASIGSAVLQAKGIPTGYAGIDGVGLAKDLIIDKPFSRSQETEADEVGLMLMAESGYNPSAAPTLWEKMAAATGDTSALGSLVSTHPTNADRQANLKRLLPEAMKVYQASR